VVTPVVPPYAHLNKEAVQCIAQASLRYEVPELLMHAVINKENGRTGQCVKNRNGTQDCGLAQINTAWDAYFAKQGVHPAELRTNACLNISASAYILKYNYIKKRNWPDAVISYNIGPNNWTPTRYQIGYRYAKDVVSRWWGFHEWVVTNSARNPAAAMEFPAE
jgi:soluble lytic murein transglycosylase-like protein